MGQLPLYFVALCPDESEQQIWDSLKERAAQEFQSFKSLSSPLHLTLIPPFRLSVEKIIIMEAAMGKLTKLALSAELFINGVKCFFPKTVYLAIKPNESLNQTRNKLFQDLQREGLNFVHSDFWVPHLTLLNRDLDAERCTEAVRRISEWEIPEAIRLNRLILFEHDGAKWKYHRVWKLQRCDQKHQNTPKL